MANKTKTSYVCTQCGENSIKWVGQCPSCQQWNTMQEFKESSGKKSRSQEGYAGAGIAKPENLSKVDTSEKKTRYTTTISELDRVLGGGFVEGEVVLLGGDPGIGKSTLLLQTISHMSARVPCLYVTGEESLDQTALRAQRLGVNVDEVDAFCEVQLENIFVAIKQKKPKFVVIDSIQTIYSEALEAAAGTVSQVRECAAALTRYAKTTGTIIVLVGHVTKDGHLAGPRVLEHIVDAVLYFEGDPQMSYRMIRAFKNRFGAIHELGVFSMGEKGLSEVTNPSAIFLTQHKKPVSGSCVAAISEGNRSLLLEVQALVEDTQAPNPRRLGVGMDQNRLSMILAVIQKNLGIPTSAQNVFINITSGVRIGETGGDLPALLSLVSSIRNKPLPDKMIVFGEVGLTGELRVVQKGLERLTEAAKLGFKRAIIPTKNLPADPIPGLEIRAVDDVAEALLVISEWEQGA